MKAISNYINEARQVEYRVSLIDVKDHEDLPVTVSILVPWVNQKTFEKFLEDQQDNLFAHADGGNVEY